MNETSQVYRCKKALNMGMNWSLTGLKSSWIAVEFYRRVTVIILPVVMLDRVTE